MWLQFAELADGEQLGHSRKRRVALSQGDLNSYPEGRTPKRLL